MKKAATYHRGFARAFNRSLGPLRWLRLHGVYTSGTEVLPPSGSAVLVANHVSWWDGFVLHQLFLAHSDGAARLYTVMLEEQLRRYPLFRRLGCIGIQPGRPSSLADALRFIADRAAEGPVWLSFFPQGAIWPSTRRPLGFRAGVEHFIARLPGAPVFPVGLHLEPLNHARPSLFAAVGPSMPEAATAAALEASVALELDAVHDRLHRHGEAALTTWPGTRVSAAPRPWANVATPAAENEPAPESAT